MAASSSSPGLARLSKVLAFFIGIFGACAILGVYFKIAKLPNYELFMKIGFFGEAGAFILMGVLELAGAFFMRRETEPAAVAATATPVPGIDPKAVQASFHRMIEERLNQDLNVVMLELAKQVKRFGEELQHMGSDMEQARMAVHTMHAEITRVATGSLAASAEQMGSGMRRLGEDMQGASHAVEAMKRDLDEMAARFQLFNDPSRSGVNGHGQLTRVS